jgi:DNA-directed RNA polymerase specialized sigma24 family protein
MTKVCARWLPKRWQQELTQKVRSTKQNKTAFSDFIDCLRRDNLLLKGSPFHLSPSQLCTQIESNISPELAAAFDRYKDNHDSSDEDSEKENNVPDDPDALATTTIVKATSDVLKAKTRLQSFVDTLTKLDQKLIEDRNTRKCDTEEAARSLKWSSSTVRLSDGS